MNDNTNLISLNLDLAADKIRQVAFSNTDALASPEETLNSLTVYAKLKSLENIVADQLKALEKRLNNAAQQHKDATLTAQAEFIGFDAAGHPTPKSIVVTIGEMVTYKDEILADTLRADFGVGDAKVDDVTDTVSFHVPKNARPLLKDIQVLPINDRAIKREIACGHLDPKYVLTHPKTIYGATATINTVKGAN